MKKLLNKKGFTLMEMLIVVAIIVILVAISIPAFSDSLDKAKVATDAANLRSAKAKVALELAAGSTSEDDVNGKFYNIKTGELVDSSDDLEKGSCSQHKDAYITVASGQAIWSAGPADCSQN